MFAGFLETIGYEVAGTKRKNLCPVRSFFDFVLLIAYVVTAIVNVWIYDVQIVPYVLTICLSFRSIIGMWTKYKVASSGRETIIVAYTIKILVYLMLTIVLGAFVFLLSEGEVSGKVTLTLYYGVYLIFETIEILVRGYDAKPRVYKLA